MDERKQKKKRDGSADNVAEQENRTLTYFAVLFCVPNDNRKQSAMEGYFVVWTSWNRKVVLGKGSRHRGQLDLLLGLVLRFGFEMDGRV